MRKFDIVNQGYDPSQVDAYFAIVTKKYEEKLMEIANENYAINNELARMKNKMNEYQQNEKQVSKALIVAVEKAEEIEKEAKRIADAELCKLKEMYQKWEELLHDAEKTAAGNGDSAPIKNAIKDFKKSIADYTLDCIPTGHSGIKEQLKKNGSDYIRNILNKMDYVLMGNDKKEKEVETVKVANHLKKSTIETKKTETVVEKKVDKKEEIKKVDMKEVMAEHTKENNRIASIGGRLLNLNKQVKRAKGENLADQFLNADIETDTNAYAKTFNKKKRPKELDFQYPTPNESGFDLKEALNPHDNLDTIMSSFDFYNGNSKKKD